MVLVDIYVPAVGNVYDFQLEEGEKVGTVIEEIGELIGQKEHCRMIGNIDRLMLCCQKENMILPKNRTLSEVGIRNGDSLILV